MTALLPAFLCALLAFWSGTFHGGAGWLGALCGDVAVVAFALHAAPRLRDPLRLGPGAETLLWAFVAVLAASTVASPVPRAGLERLAVLPAFLLVPAAIERLWRDPERRRAGWRSLAVVALGVALFGLAGAIASGSLRAAAPLGHHGALAVWLLFLLPFAALAARERGAWRPVGAMATATVAVALLATRSVVGAALLAVQAAMLLRGRSRGWALAAVVALAAGFHAPRLVAIVTGADPSIAARGAYFAAALDGARARPALGWGPGSVGLTVGGLMQPAPGRNPPGEVVSYLHFLPLDLAYQLGIAGALLAAAVVVAFLMARRSERAAADPDLLEAATASLVPGLAALCLAGFQPLGATVSAAAIAAGAALAATRSSGPVENRRPSGEGSWRGGRIAIVAYAVVAFTVLAPVRLAHRLYDQARVAERPLHLLADAVDHDRSFALYTARRSFALAADEATATTAADEALRAAQRAPGVAALWLAAGLLGADLGAPWSEAALRRACDLDPLGALPPFRLAVLRPDQTDSAVMAARSLLAEPRLAAAIDWYELDDLYGRAIEEVARWPGVDPRWRDQLAATLHALPPAGGRPTRPFFLELDAQSETSLSLFVFRRLPWRAAMGAADLDVGRLRRVAGLGSAALRPDTASWAFARNGCGGAEPPG